LIFSKKPHCFPTCALFYPIGLKRKIITDYTTHDAPVIAAKIINIAQGNTMDFAE